MRPKPRAIILEILREENATEVIKIKTMTSAEIELNPALEAAGISVFETDLAELDSATRRRRAFAHRRARAARKPQPGARDLSPGAWASRISADDPQALTAAARTYLRKKFLSVPTAISGANFLVAETGSVAIVESEGNGRMCLTLPRTLITLAGIEKVLPRFRDLEVMLQVLARSATGERMNPYTSLWTGVTPGDGPQRFHVVLLDNGRSSILARPRPNARRSSAFAAPPARTPAPSTARPAATPTARSMAAPSAPSSRRNSCAWSMRNRCLLRRRSAVRATRFARSRSTSPKCSLNCARRSLNQERHHAARLFDPMYLGMRVANGNLFQRAAVSALAQRLGRIGSAPVHRQGRLDSLPAQPRRTMDSDPRPARPAQPDLSRVVGCAPQGDQ